MIFSNKISKFGKGENVSAHMKTNNQIDIFYYKNGVYKKEVEITNNGLILNSVNVNLPYNEVIQIDNFLITRIDRSIGIILNNE